MANTFDSGLVLDVVSKQAVTTLGKRLAFIKSFATDLSDEVVDPRRGLVVPVVTGGATVATNASSYTPGTTTKVAKTVTMSEYSVTFDLSNAELNQGHRLEQSMAKNLQNLANALQDAALAPVTAANFATSAGVITAEEFTTADLPTVWAAAASFGTRNLVLDGSYYAKLIPQNTFGFSVDQGKPAYGFDGVFYTTRMDGAESGVKGFVADSTALAFASRVPAVSSAVSGLLDMDEIITIPDLGLSVHVAIYGNTTGFSTVCRMAVCFGAKEADTTALARITNV